MDSIDVALHSAVRKRPTPAINVRSGTVDDLTALLDLETAVFATDRMSRRSLRHFLTATTAVVIVAEFEGMIAGYALVLFRPRSAIARLYSIAVTPAAKGRGIGPTLLAAAEDVALGRDCRFLRLEVHENNQRAIDRYRKAGYRAFGRYDEYYEDKGHAHRYQKQLAPRLRGLSHPPPYFHQTTDFTCGPACMMMALAWADRSFRHSPAEEFRLWREATTIFMTSGPGGCEPYGIAVTLKRRGLDTEIYVSRAAPYFLDTAKSVDKRRVMTITQDDFQRNAKALAIPTHLTSAGESVLMPALTSGATAIVLVCGHHMVPRGQPHWVFAFGYEGRYVLVHDPAAVRDEHGHAAEPETYAIPWPEFARMTRYGRDDLSAAILIRKGPLT